MSTTDNSSIHEISLEPRADYIPEEDLESETSSDSDLFSAVQDALLNSALKTIVGPRGCGKTHMMRFAWLKCRADVKKPFAAYVSFNRYYRLEPLLIARSRPSEDFHSWALSLIIVSIFNSLPEETEQFSVPSQAIENKFGINKFEIESLIGCLERNQPLSETQQLLSSKLTISLVQSIADEAVLLSDRRRIILLLDDAALTLTPPYLEELLDIVRALKSPRIAPKISVYPGTTEYSPKFHAGQDHTPVDVWLSVTSESYIHDMDSIARLRVPNFVEYPDDVKDILRFAAFGIPRAYLTMLWQYKEKGKNFQQNVNRIIEEHYEARISEFRSLKVKVPKLEKVIEAGEDVLMGMYRKIKSANEDSSSGVQYMCGFQKDEMSPLSQRMFQLLIEAGLIFDLQEVKHGTPERIYKRFMPHTAGLLRTRALTSNDPGGSLRGTVEAIKKKRAKHPIRQQLTKIASSPQVISSLSFALPVCNKCGAARLTDTQKFCHTCGSVLIEVSTFSSCLEWKIKDVPGLTQWQQERIKKEMPQLKTIQDYLALQDPVLELRTIYGFGKARTQRIADVLKTFVDDFLS